MTKNLTCTCGSRYVRDGDHEGDCDLWLIDEFWAGFLAWDWDREILIPTDSYPTGHTSDYVDELEQYEWDQDSPVQKRLGEMSDEDIALTTDTFIERMMKNSTLGVDDDGTWVKGDDGLWKRVEDEGYSTRSRLPGQAYSSPYSTDNWDNYSFSDRHTSTPVHFPDGSTVYATSRSKSNDPDRLAPDYALYLDMGWVPESMAVMLPWRDYGLPNVPFNFADYAIKEAFNWVKSGAIVEVGCIGAHGRTGTVLACMAILADPELTATEAVTFVRTAFCHHAIETREQEWYVARFRAAMNNEPEPERPVYVAPKPLPQAVNTDPKGTATSKTSHSGGQTTNPDPTKPGRAKRARRSKRGGRRVQAHRNRMSQGSRA